MSLAWNLNYVHFLLAAPTITAVKIDPQSAFVAVGTPIVVRCSANASVTPSISWLTGLEDKDRCCENDTKSIIEITYNSTGVKKIMCLVKDNSSGDMDMETAKITVVGQCIVTTA